MMIIMMIRIMATTSIIYQNRTWKDMLLLPLHLFKPQSQGETTAIREFMCPVT